MTAVSFDISMSLDGYIAAPNRRSEEPLGDNGERLHEWAFSSDTVGREVLARGGESTGAVICGRVDARHRPGTFRRRYRSRLRASVPRRVRKNLRLPTQALRVWFWRFCGRA